MNVGNKPHVGRRVIITDDDSCLGAKKRPGRIGQWKKPPKKSHNQIENKKCKKKKKHMNPRNKNTRQIQR